MGMTTDAQKYPVDVEQQYRFVEAPNGKGVLLLVEVAHCPVCEMDEFYETTGLDAYRQFRNGSKNRYCPWCKQKMEKTK